MIQLAFWTLPLLALLCTAGQGADKSVERLHPDRQKALAEVQGRIQAIDASSRRLTVEDDAHQKITVTATPDVRLLDSANHQVKLESLRPGDRVTLYYNTREQTAFQIDLLPTPAETLLGKP